LDKGCTHESIIGMIEHANDPVEFTREWFEQSFNYYTFEIERMMEECRC